VDSFSLLEGIKAGVETEHDLGTRWQLPRNLPLTTAVECFPIANQKRNPLICADMLYIHLLYCRLGETAEIVVGSHYERLRTLCARATYILTVLYYSSTVSTIRAMSVNIDLRVYTGNNVLLPGSQVPRPATVLVSTKTGKIIDVREGRHVRADYADIASSDDDRWTDVGDKYLLPGLVE
jgi:hypothetical protein